MPDPIRIVIDHPAPLAIRWGRGNTLGLFAVRTRTPVEIRAVDPGDLARPSSVPGYVDPEVRIHDRRLWIPVEAIGANGMGRGRATLAEALAHLSDPPRRDRTASQGGVIGLNHPPFKTPYGWELHHARAIQDAGEIPRSAGDAVDLARMLASRAMSAHAASHLLQDGERLYARMPVPLLSAADSMKPTTATLMGLHKPSFLHTRLGPGGSIPYDPDFSIPHLEVLARQLDPLLEGIDTDGEDIERFLVSAPAALVSRLRAIRDPAVEPLLERLFPLLVSGARAEAPECGVEAAADTVRAAVETVREKGQHTLGAGFSKNYGMLALNCMAGFVERVVRPSLADPAHAVDEDAIAVLAP